MKFTVVAAAALAAVVRAQDPASVAKFFSDLGGYYSSLQGNPEFVNAFAGLATQSPELLSSLLALQTNTDIGQITSPPAIITQLPSPYNALLSSVFSDQQRIASSDGILSDGRLVGSAGGALSSAVDSARSAVASATSMAGSMASTASTGAAASASTASAGASSAAAGATSSRSSGGAPAPTGMVVMGAAAGLIGGLAALL